MRCRRLVSVVLGSALCLAGVAGRASADEARVTRTTPRPNTIVYRVDRPNVKQPMTDYPADSFEPGDRILLDAGGCVQTGGRGRTWKRYANPSGSGSDLYYSGTVSIPPVVNRPQRIGGLLGTPIDIPVTAPRERLFLRLGYQDDNYRDNGYHGHDNGTENQCRGVGPAWVSVTVQRGLSPRRIQGPRYNEIYQRSAHNSFQHTGTRFAGKVLKRAWTIYQLLDELKFRSIEFDLRYDDCIWKVYHHWIDKGQTTCKTLAGCLGQVRRFHDANPNHEVVTVFLDLKDSFRPRDACRGRPGELWSRSPEGFDGFLAMKLGETNLYTPKAMKESCPKPRTLRDVARACGWPLLEKLRGKVLLVLEGEIPTYAPHDGDGLRRTAFLMQGVKSRKEFHAQKRARRDVLFYNFDDRGHWDLTREIYRLVFVTRVWVMNSREDFQRAENGFIHHIATDEIHAPFTRLQDHWQWPFACRSTDCSTLREGLKAAGREKPPRAPASIEPPRRGKLGASSPRVRAPASP